LIGTGFDQSQVFIDVKLKKPKNHDTDKIQERITAACR
jgi:hypothetical protein